MSKRTRRNLVRSPFLFSFKEWSQHTVAVLQKRRTSAARGQRPSAGKTTQKITQKIPDSAATREKKRSIRIRRAQSQKWRVVVLVVVLFIPSFLIPYELTNAILIYTQMQDGVRHLQEASSVFSGDTSGGFARYFDLSKLQQAQTEIDAAHADFVSLSARFDTDGPISMAAVVWPAQINTARALGRIASDGTAVAQQVLQTMSEISPSVAPALQSTPPTADDAPLTPIITPDTYQKINTMLDTIAPLVHRIALDAQGISLSSLPLSSKQQKLVASILPVLPALDAVLMQRDTLSDPLGWLLGIGQQRSFLIEPMDSSELRATGGFTGQFGELHINGGHVGPLKLANIGVYEEDHTDEGSPPDETVYSKVRGQLAPLPYATWWPIPNFGMRDANVSADYPTSAQLVMDRYNYEFGQSVDGVIMFTPGLIQQVLHVTGPITIAKYNETITEYNLMDRLHYYQLDNSGITQEERIENIWDPQVARKLFTQKLTTQLIDTATHLPPDKLLALANQMFHAMKTKDLEVYVTNPQLETLIGKYGSTASMDRSASHDGLFIVQSNLSASKASQYVKTTVHDTIKLDAQGGATHQLQLTLDYQQTGDVYGLDTYRDYLRVYVPENSQFLDGNGFDQHGEAYCGDGASGYQVCDANVYGDGTLVCATPIEIGYAASMFDDPYSGTDHPLDRIGSPENLQSDEPGRAMFGGWVVIPKNCTMQVTLSWYVPPISGQPYSLLLQAQSGLVSPVDLTVEPYTGACSLQQGNGLHFSDNMDGEDRFISMEQQGSQCSLVAS
jgi:hypothetical protein